jgi:hypothetical protein
MQFTGSHQGVQHGTPLSGFMASGEQVIFSTDCNRADGPFYWVIIDI